MKNKILTVSFIIMIVGMFMLNIFIKDRDLSYSERRHLTKFPSITINGLMDGSISDEFENYSTDQFVFRENFIKLKAYIQHFILKKQDINGLFIEDGNIVKMEYPFK